MPLAFPPALFLPRALAPILLGPILLGLALGAVPGVAPAKVALDLYECHFAQRASNKGWIPEMVLVARAPGAETATVNDPILQHFEGAPKDAPVSDETARRFTLKWEVTTASSTSQSATMRYTLILRPAERSAKIRANPAGYGDNFSSDGTCTLGKT